MFYCLDTYGHLLKGKLIHFQNDNKAVYNTFLVGGRNQGLNRLLRMIHRRAEELNVQLKISWVATDKQLADLASRTVDIKESIFRAAHFRELQASLGIQFTLDAFATGNNKKCDAYISLRREEGAWAQDFFMVQNFKDQVIWAFPPQVMLLQVFQRLMKVARNNIWALVILEYEMTSPIWVEARKSKSFSRFDLEKLGDPILFPSKVMDEALGFWKIPKKARCHLLVHQPVSRKRCTDSCL